jgi:hypothetical protein
LVNKVMPASGAKFSTAPPPAAKTRLEVSAATADMSFLINFMMHLLFH